MSTEKDPTTEPQDAAIPESMPADSTSAEESTTSSAAETTAVEPGAGTAESSEAAAEAPSEPEAPAATSEETSEQTTAEAAPEATVDAPAEVATEPSAADAPAEQEPSAETETTAEPEAAETPAEEPAPVIPTFTGELSDIIYTYEQLKSSSDDYTEEEFGELATMYENTLSRIEEKEIVKGVVISVDEKYVVVDIGFKSEGIVPINEFGPAVVETLQPGDEVEVFLDRVEDREGQLILSRRKADILKAWEKIETAYDTGEVVEGLIKRRIKGGMVVDVFGIDAFLPGSQIDVRPVRDFDAYVDRTMEFQIVKLNMQAENVVVSHRSLIESDLEDQRKEILESIEKGQVLEGTVKNITDFGVFIDLGGVDGLLHITDLSWGRVEHPSEIVSLDQKMNVAVIDFDPKSKRVSLGLKQLQPHPWENILAKYPEGQRVQGRVVSIADYGAFMELEKGVEGLIHVSEMSWTQHVKNPSNILKKGDIVECMVLTIDEGKHRISLGIKQLQEDPWEKLAERYPIGSIVRGVVRNTTNFGAFVQIEPGIDGLVHKNELVWKPKSIQHPSDVVSKNDEIDVMIKGINTQERKITLSHRECIENPWDAFVQENTIGAELKAKVVRIGRHELFMETEDGFSAIIDKQSLAEPVSDLDASFNIGDVMEARIRYLNNDAQLIELTQVEESEAKPKPKAAAVKKESRERAPRVKDVNSQVSAATLGDDPELAEKLAAIQKAMDAGSSESSAEEAPAEETAKPKAKKTTKTASKAKKKKEEEASTEEAPKEEAPEASGEEEA